MVLLPEGGRRETMTKGQQRGEADQHEGAVEGDRPTDKPQQGNSNAPALDDQGMPNDKDKIAEDRIGANMDETTG
jgi:hypothetical protein